MTFQERIARQTINAGEALFQSARAMPADRLSWKPGEDARTALDILQECAYTPAGLPGLLAGKGTDPGFLQEFGRIAAEGKTWTTLDALEAGYRKNIQVALDSIRGCPDSVLEQDLPVPFGAGKLTGEQIVMMCYWNTVYHMGQINYIQTLYGDREMHSGM